ncbi:DUF6894 family protein [uncultured Enterovirga sp.]|uniref:DUF6894 family protein n=1 Tax=uncultured Enterovirga sp. TaxID=2026352 RepID=UPI0035C9D04F
MPRFFFHVTDGHAFAYDQEGTDLSENAVHVEALDSARNLMADGDQRGLCRRHWEMTVANEGGEPIFKLAFGHALRADHLRTADLLDLKGRRLGRPSP